MKRLKYQYKKPISQSATRYGYFLKSYPYLRSAIFKQFSTRQERSFYFLHQIEYRDYPLKIRIARGTRLPDAWDDLSSSAYTVAKSWKHNSKRKHQSYKEHEQK